MPASAKPAKERGAARPALSARLKTAMALLEKRGRPRGEAALARYGIITRKRVMGCSVGDIRYLAKELGRDHALAQALWKQDCYEARLLAAFVADPTQVTPAMMDAWCRTFENWADTDTACFHLFDKTPHAMMKIRSWAKRKPEFEKRAAYALLASLALHDKKTPDAPFLQTLPLIEQAATDDRNFVKKGVLWALRGVGGRSPELRAAAEKLARKLKASDSSSARWIAATALREFAKRKPRPKR